MTISTSVAQEAPDHHTRSVRPVSHAADDTWEVFRYEDVQHVLTASDTWSAALSQGPTTSFNFLDPPAHMQMRAVVAHALNLRTMEQRRPHVTARIQELLERALQRDPSGLDVVADLASPLPILVLADWLGIARRDEAQFMDWARAFMTEDAFLCPPDPPGLHAYFLNLITQRRAPGHTGEDLLSGLVQARSRGDRLSDDEIVNVCRLLLMAGNDTTTYLIGNALVCLTDAGVIDQVRADPTLLPSGIEEVLRYRPPVPAMFRRARHALLLDGHHIPAGAQITAWIGAANRDPAQFPDPDCFDLTRAPQMHLAFGNGIHHCIGAPLARLVAHEALLGLLRPPVFTLDRSVPLEPIDPSGFVDGYQRLPIRFV